MASIKIAGDTSGEITVSVPSVAGTNTLTLPANTGTIVTSASGVGDLPSTIAGPAFSAYQTSGQSISTSTGTVLVFDATDYDVTSDFNTSTYKFTPSVAGYYLFTGFVRINMVDGQLVSVRLQKNESLVKNVIEASTGTGADNGWSFSTVAYANGTTDNFRLQLFHTSGVTEDTTAGSAYTTFQGTLVRAA